MIYSITVITINYNNSFGLQRTVQSVINQTWKEFEYIVIDGGSSDGSRDYLESVGEHINYWISKPDLGIYNAMNKGIKASSGEYLLFLNSGDEFIDFAILERIQKFVHTEDLIYFDLLFIFENKEIVHYYPAAIDYDYLIKNSLGHPATFIKRSLFEKVGMYDENLRIVSDWKFFIWAIVKFNCSLRKVNVVVSKFYTDGISTQNSELVRQERQVVLQKDFKEYIRLIELENFLKKIKKSVSVILLNKIGLLKYVKNMK